MKFSGKMWLNTILKVKKNKKTRYHILFRRCKLKESNWPLPVVFGLNKIRNINANSDKCYLLWFGVTKPEH